MVMWRAQWKRRKRRLISIDARARERTRPAELARSLGVTPQTVYNWAKRGRLSVSRPRPGVVLIRWAAVRKLLMEPDVAKLVARRMGG